MSLTKGKIGEQKAKSFLEEKGYTIIEQNWRFKRAEIDLIAIEGSEIIFVEVKLRKNNDFGYPEEFVGRQKIKHLWRGLEGYLSTYPEYQKLEPRIDVVAITQESGEIEHFEGVELN